MNIKIISIFSEQSALHVRFHSSVGMGIALWSGISPKIGEIVDVEIDIDEVFSWNKNIAPTFEKTSKINTRGQFTHIIAELIQASEEECAALKLGDSIILIELDGALPQKTGFVEMKATTIHLYPTDI